MNDRKWILPLLAGIAICAATSIAWPQTLREQPDPQQLIVAGSGVNLGITRLLAKAFMNDHPQIIIEVPGSIGTKGAIAAVADGAITFGLLARSLKENEESSGLVVRPYARVPIVVGVHPTVADDESTFQDLVDIYRGTKTRWKDGNEIIVLAREPGDSGMQVLEKKVPGFLEAYAESARTKRWSIFFTDQDANRALSITHYAIGISDLGMLATENLNVKVLKLNGIAPTPENLLDGRYPLSRDLSFLYRAGTLPEGAKAFLDFVRSDKGAGILRSHGYIPVN